MAWMDVGDQSRSARKRRQIVAAATKVFLRRGYRGASMDEIAALAQVSKQTVYKHFADKEQLFTDIVLGTTGQVDQVVQMVAGALTGTTDLDQDLRVLARRFLVALMRPELLQLRRLVLAEADRFPEVGTAWYEHGFDRVLSTLATCFGQLANRGLLGNLQDPLLAANHFVGMLLWIPVNRVMFCGRDDLYSQAELERLADAAVTAFLAGHAPRS